MSELQAVSKPTATLFSGFFPSPHSPHHIHQPKFPTFSFSFVRTRETFSPKKKTTSNQKEIRKKKPTFACSPPSSPSSLLLKSIESRRTQSRGDQKNQEEVERSRGERIKVAGSDRRSFKGLRAGGGCCVTSCCYHPVRSKKMMMDDDWERLSQSSSPGAASDTSSVGSSTDHSVGLGPVPARRSSFSYHRLPDPRLRLSVLKLDNTSFEVKIAMTATVSELRTAVEGVFRDHSEDDGGAISWTHVWGHFCLCYEDYKLVDDRACIKDYGIKDGDQLRFIRHLSVTTPTKTQATQPTAHEAIVELNVLRLTGPEDPTELEEVNRNNNSNDNSPVSPDEGSLFFHRNQKRTEEIVAARAEFRLVHWLRTWISHTKLASPRKSPRTPSPRTPKAGKYF